VPRRLTDQERLTKYVTRTDDCWLWTGARTHAGYGLLTINYANHYAHRWSYELHVGPIPPGLDLDHLCRVRHCVNPEHLEPVTRKTNLNRGAGNGGALR
jgi:hypothetical protein